jgi:hypothetical protein
MILQPMTNNSNCLESKGYQKTRLLFLIKSELIEMFGKQLDSYGDCVELSNDIFSRIQRRINPNTLRRLFGLVPNNYLPSFNTLNILAQYCGFESLEEIEHRKLNRQDQPDDYNGKQYQSYLISLFKHIPAKDYNDETFLALTKRTILFLQKYPNLADRIQRAIAKTKNGQDFYFEQFVNIDGLNIFFGKGLLYYLNEKKTTEAQILGHSLLCTKGYLSNDPAYVKTHHQEVIKHRLNKSIHPFVCGRYFASQIYYADMYGLDLDPILMNAHQVHSGIRPGKDNYRSFPCFEYVLSSALFLAGRYEEVLYFIDYGKQNYRHRHSYVEDGLYHSLDLLYAYALLKTGEQAEAKKIFKNIQPSGFYFLTKKINTVLYLKMKKEIKGWNEADENVVTEIIKETGFSGLEKI